MSSAFWDRYAAYGYDALRVLTPYMALQRTLMAAVAPAEHERLLVAGCGTGNLEWMLVQEQPALAIEAVDFSAAMLAQARAKCAAYPQIRHQQADLCARLPYPDGAIDVAVMCNVLYALPDGLAALREIRRVLRPGGRFILCDPQPGSGIGPVIQAHVAALRGMPPGESRRHWLRSILTLPRFALLALPNLGIQQRFRDGSYRIYTLEAIEAVLTAEGFAVGERRTVYAEQCWLVRAERHRPAGELAHSP